jgi:hypothetical protein
MGVAAPVAAFTSINALGGSSISKPTRFVYA